MQENLEVNISGSNFYKEFWNIDEDVLKLAAETETKIAPVIKKLENIREYNQLKVVKAFHQAGVTESSFYGSTGYGHDDRARMYIEKVFANALEAEAAFVRTQICSATQAINIALFACLRTGDEILLACGAPYDTLQTTILGRHIITDHTKFENEKKGDLGFGSLSEYGISHKQVDLNADGHIDVDSVLNAIGSKTKLVYFQRSRGYSSREALDVEEIGACIEKIKALKPDIIIFVDNCYGTFVQQHEPTYYGADLMAGSLIKNAGGGLTPIGAYIVGRKDLIEQCGNRLYAPGLGADVGPMLDLGRIILQGFYMAPHTVCETLKGLVFCAALFEAKGFKTSPKWNDKRSDIVQTVTCAKADLLLKFCQAIQNSAPIDSMLTLIPSMMPGYPCEVVMAAGAFVQGSSIELSADGPLREPYMAYMQGGLVYENVKLAGLLAANSMK